MGERLLGGQASSSLVVQTSDDQKDLSTVWKTIHTHVSKNNHVFDCKCIKFLPTLIPFGRLNSLHH